MADETSLSVSLIKDEDVLRKMWQDTEDFGKKKEIRTRMYKLREARLRDFYNTGDVCKDVQRANSSPGLREKTTKVGDMSTHAESLADHSFLSLKTKEIRDSESPTREMYKVGVNQADTKSKTNNQGWNVVSTDERSIDGKTHSIHKVATTSGTDKIDGGVSAYAAKSEMKSSHYADGDADNYTKAAGTASHNVIHQEAVGGDDNSSFRSTSTKTSSSSKVVSESKFTSGDLNNTGTTTRIINESGAVVPKYVDDNTKVTQETHTLPDGTIVTRTRYETTGTGSVKSSSKQTSTSSSSTKINATQKQSTVVSSEAPSETIIVRKTTTYDQSNVPVTIDITKNIHDDSQIIKTTANEKIENIKSSNAYVDVKSTENVEKQNFQTTSTRNIKTQSIHGENINSLQDNKQKVTEHVIIPLNQERPKVETAQTVVTTTETKRTNIVKGDENVSSDNKIVTEHQVLSDKVRVPTSEPCHKEVNGIQQNATTEVIRTTKYQDNIEHVPFKKPETPSEHSTYEFKPAQRYERPKQTYEKTSPTEGQYDTTYRTEFTNKRISVDVSPTHDAFARSLRAVSPDHISKCSTPSRGSTRSLRTSTTSLRSSTSPEKHPHRQHSPLDRRTSPEKYSHRQQSPLDRRTSPEKYPSGRPISPEKYSNRHRTSPSGNRISPENYPSNLRSSPEKSPTSNRQRSPDKYSKSPEKFLIDRQKTPTDRRSPDRYSFNNRVSPTKSPAGLPSSPIKSPLNRRPSPEKYPVNGRQTSPEKSPSNRRPSPEKYPFNGRQTSPEKSPSNRRCSPEKSPSNGRQTSPGKYPINRNPEKQYSTRKSPELPKERSVSPKKSPSPDKYSSTDTITKTKNYLNSFSTTETKITTAAVTNQSFDSSTITRKSKPSGKVLSPRSVSPTSIASDIEFVRSSDLVTDLDDVTVITTNTYDVNKTTEKRPTSLEIDKISITKVKKIKDRSPSSPLTDFARGKPLPVAKTSPKGNDTPSSLKKPKDKPLKRTDTYEERCREILGISKDTDKNVTKDVTETVVKSSQKVLKTTDATENVSDALLRVNKCVNGEDTTKTTIRTQKFIENEIKKETDDSITVEDSVEKYSDVKKYTETDDHTSYKKVEKDVKQNRSSKPEIQEFPSQVRRSPEKEPQKQKPDSSRKSPEKETNKVGITEFPSQKRPFDKSDSSLTTAETLRTKTTETVIDTSTIRQYPSQKRKSPEKEFSVKDVHEITKETTDRSENVNICDESSRKRDTVVLGIQEFPSQIHKSPEKEKLETNIAILTSKDTKRKSLTKEFDKTEEIKTKISKQETSSLGIQEFPSQIRKSPEKQPTEQSKHEIPNKQQSKPVENKLTEFPSQMRKSPETKPTSKIVTKQTAHESLNIIEHLTDIQKLTTKDVTDHTSQETIKKNKSNIPYTKMSSEEKEKQIFKVGEVKSEETTKRHENVSTTFLEREKLSETVSKRKHSKKHRTISQSSESTTDEELENIEDVSKKGITNEEVSKTTSIPLEQRIPVNEPLFIRKHINISCPDDETHRHHVHHHKDNVDAPTDKHSPHKTVKKDSAGPYEPTQYKRKPETVQKEKPRTTEPKTPKITTTKPVYRGEINDKLQKTNEIKGKVTTVTVDIKGKSSVGRTSFTEKQIKSEERKSSPQFKKSSTPVSEKRPTKPIKSDTDKKEPRMQVVKKTIQETTKTQLKDRNEPQNKRVVVTASITVSPKTSVQKTTTTKTTVSELKVHVPSKKVTSRHGSMPLNKPKYKIDSDDNSYTIKDSVITNNRQNQKSKITRTTSEKIMKTTRKTPSRDVAPGKTVKNKPDTKCITTKSIIINNEVTSKGEVVVDLQRSKSSREPTPDRLCPLPVSSDDDYGSPRYPDKVTEPEETGTYKKPKKLRDIPILEDENSSSTKIEISEDCDRYKRITDVDRVQETDECLLSVNQKVNKFITTAEQLTKNSEKTTRHTIDHDKNLLSVGDKLNKFINNAENITKPNTFVERPLSPYCQNHDDDITNVEDLSVSDKVSRFIKTAEKLVSDEKKVDTTIKFKESYKQTVPSHIQSKESHRKPSPKRNLDNNLPERKSPERKSPERKSPERKSTTYLDITPKTSKRIDEQKGLTSQLRSTESILKARALFENIDKKETTRQRDILSRPSIFDKKRPKTPDTSEPRKTILSPVRNKLSPEKDQITNEKNVMLKSTRLVMDRVKTKSPERGTRSRSRETTPDSDLPGYMKPLDRSLRPNSPHKENVAVIDTINQETSKFGVTLRDTKPINLTTDYYKKPEDNDDIENIYNLTLLEEMLVKSTDYDLRRRIRAQIRVLKSTEEQKHSTFVKTTSISKAKTPEPIRKSSTEVKSTVSSEYQTSYTSTERRTSSTSTERRSSSTSTTRRSQSPQKIVLEQIIRKSPEPKVKTTETTRKLFTDLKKTTPVKKNVTNETPEWVTQVPLKKASDRKVTEKTVKKIETIKKRTSPVRETKPIDVITSSYGVGPLDENGTPLFGLKALRVKDQTKTKMQGSIVQSQFYSESGKEPVGEIRVTKYSTDPKDLDLGEDITTPEGLTILTTTQKYGQGGTKTSDKRNYNQKEICDVNNDVRTSTRTTSSKFTRRGSVKALSQKFIENSVETIKNERQSSYPKAGLILRTSSFKDSTTADKARSGSSREGSPGVQETHQLTTVKSSSISKSNDNSTFLTNKTRVTGVQDVLNRMKNCEEVREGENVEDAEARTLLNKFLGAQVLLTGMEEMNISRQVPSTVTKHASTKVTSTVTKGGKPTTVTRIFEHPVTEKDLDTVWDEQTLRLLLEQSVEYDERRIIRARLRQVMAEQEACTELVEKASREHTSGAIEEKVETIKQTSFEGPITTSQVTTKVTCQQSAKKPMSPFAKFRQLDKQNSINTPPGTPKTPSGSGPLFKFTDPAVSHSASTIKDRLLQWCQMKTKEYENIQLDNFSTSWADGLAFCALIHHFLPDAFDYYALTPKNRRHNFTLAFQIADDKAGIAPLLDVDDMVSMRKPDWKCVFTYVQSIYRRFKDED